MRSPTIQTLLIRLVLMVWAPSVVVIAALLWYGYDRVRFRIQETNLTTVRALAASVDAKFIEIRTGLQALAESPALANGDLAGFEAQARQFLHSSSLAVNVVLIDRSRTQILNAMQPAGKQFNSVPGRAEMLALFDGGEMAITDRFTGPVMQVPIIAIGCPGGFATKW
jgi:hypothetical protein